MGGAVSRGGGANVGDRGENSEGQGTRATWATSVGGAGAGLAASAREASGGVEAGDGSGLNPNRIRGFGVRQPVGGRGGGRLETPTLNEMKAKQGAIVAKFMTFFRRKNTLVIEMYEKSFYKQKPTWDRIADFVYKDLCNHLT